MDNIDVFIGGLSDNLLPSNHFVWSRPYYHDKMTWCVRIKQPIPIWQNLFYICRDPKVYVLFTLMCIAVVFFGYFIQQYEDLYPKWNWFRLSLAGMAPCWGAPSEYNPKIIPNRIFFIFCIFGALLTYIVATSFYLLLLTNPRFEDQIKLRHEIIDERFELVGEGFALQHLMKQNQVNFDFSFVKCK